MIYSIYSLAFLLFISACIYVSASSVSEQQSFSSHHKIPDAVLKFIEEKSLKEDHHFRASSVPPTDALPKNLYPTSASLISAIVNQQQLEDTTYIPLFRNEKQAGIWPSYIHLNLYGVWPLPDIRRGIGFLDNNAFVAEWLLEMLIEADELQPVDNSLFKTAKYSDFSSFLKYSVQALFPAYVNKNKGQYFPGNEFDSAFLFWVQNKIVNGTHVTYPTNFAVPLELAVGGTNPLLEWLRNIIGVTVNDCSIPADFDDTAASIQVYLYIKDAAKKNPAKYGAALEVMNQAFFGSSSVDGTNELAKKVFTLLDRYAYKPYSSNKDANVIDPRTYYWMRPLIHSSPVNASFITTWLETRGENFRFPLQGPNMPALINDIDGGVVANAFFMLLSIVPRITDSQLLTADIINILESTESMISYLIDSRMYDLRADLVLKYYPSVIQFLYFISRSVRFINSSPQFPARLANLGRRVQQSMQTAGIDFLLKKMKSNDACKDSLPNKKVKSNVNCFDEFLGNADRNLFNMPTPNYEDRIATTALAANAMIDIHTSIDASSTLSWIANTPAAVKSAVAGCINFLKQAITVADRPLENSFFSGFAKDNTDFTYFYPFNTVAYRNGSAVPSDAKPPTKVSEYSIGVSGVVEESVYQQMIKNKPFGHDVPQGVWYGNNVNATRLVYWTSAPITLAATNLALAKAEKLTF